MEGTGHLCKRHTYQKLWPYCVFLYSLLLVHLNQIKALIEEFLIVFFQGEIVCIHNCTANV